MTKKNETKTKDESFDWDELDEDKEQKDTVENPQPAPEEEKPTEKSTTDIIVEMRALRDKHQKHFGQNVDVVLMYMGGISGIRPYIVRSMSLKDQREMDDEIFTECQQKLEEMRVKAKEEGLSEEAAQLSPQDQDELGDLVMIRKFTIYPEDMAEQYEEGTCRPGDAAECMKTIMALSGFFPPAYDEGGENLPVQNFMDQAFGPGTQVDNG